MHKSTQSELHLVASCAWKIFSQCDLSAGFHPGCALSTFRFPHFSSKTDPSYCWGTGTFQPSFFFCPRHVRMHIYMYTYTSFFPPFWPRLLIEFAASRWQHKTGNYSPIIHFTAIVCEPCLLRQFPAATSIAVQEDAPWAARTDEEGPPSPGTPGLEIAHFWPWCIRALHSHRRRHKSAEKWNFSIDGGSVSKLWLNFFISLLVSIIYVDLFCVRAIYLFIWGS